LEEGVGELEEEEEVEGGGGDRLSLGSKTREFKIILNHSTRQAKGFDNEDKSGVLSHVART
jgi:hypothetical protein